MPSKQLFLFVATVCVSSVLPKTQAFAPKYLLHDQNKAFKNLLDPCSRPQQKSQLSTLLRQSKIDSSPDVSIEYCTGCRWMLRSAWMAQELLTTFRDEINSVTLIPSRPPSPGGTFVISLDDNIIWDRKANGGFPESKILKQLIRDKIAPEKELGHSDVSDKESKQFDKPEKNDCDECKENEKPQGNLPQETDNSDNMDEKSSMSPQVSVLYCSASDWLLRSAWACQEVISNFPENVNSVSLRPDKSELQGQFIIAIDDTVIWDLKKEGTFPNAEQLIKTVHDYFYPKEQQDEGIDDETAAEMRSYYGVL